MNMNVSQRLTSNSLGSLDKTQYMYCVHIYVQYSQFILGEHLKLLMHCLLYALLKVCEVHQTRHVYSKDRKEFTETNS